MEAPENAKIIYANERGLISNNLEKYSMGTFAEIQCDNDMVVDGENFLSCAETTLWDYPLPKCVMRATTDDAPDQNTMNPMSAITTSDRDDNSMEEETDDLFVPTATAPTMAFWQSLKKFLYHGCHSLRNTSSELCWKASKLVEFTDLSTFQPPETDEPMDRLLLEHLQRCVGNLSKFSFAQKLTFENVFDCITNGIGDVKDSLRLIVCFYIDTVASTNDSTRVEDSITDQIKRHLKRIVTVVFQNYLRDISYDILTDTDDSTRTTAMRSESECNLMLIPTFPANTTIRNVTSHKMKSTIDLTEIRLVPVFVPEISKVYFECPNGYQLIGKDYTECLFGEWTDIGFDCERKVYSICVIPTTKSKKKKFQKYFVNRHLNR